MGINIYWYDELVISRRKQYISVPQPLKLSKIPFIAVTVSTTIETTKINNICFL